MVGTLEPEAWPQPQEGLGQHRMLQPPHRSTPPHTQVSILLDEYLIISGGEMQPWDLVSAFTVILFVSKPFRLGNQSVFCLVFLYNTTCKHGSIGSPVYSWSCCYCLFKVWRRREK